MVPRIFCGLRLSPIWKRLRTLGAFRQWTEENNCVPKGIVGDQAFFTPQFMSYYKFHGITPYPCGPRTPWPNRAETAVRLFKRTWSIMAKALADEGYAERVTVRQAVKKGGVGKKLPIDRFRLFSFRDSYRTAFTRHQSRTARARSETRKLWRDLNESRSYPK